MRKWFKIAVIFVLVLILGAGIALFFWLRNLQIPDFEALSERKVVESTKIYDRTGEILLYDIHENIRRTVVPWDDIPYHLKNATVAIEDKNFYRHGGVSFKGIIRALIANFKKGGISQGASTITQQLVKNTFLVPERTYTRKIKEVILALKIEREYTKEEILNLYLNEIPYGGTSYGVESASRMFFGKSVKDLTLAESAYLASLPKAPSYYSPYGPHREELEQRKNFVLRTMRELGFISEKEEEQARKEKVVFKSAGKESLKAPHFVMYVKDYLESKYGKDMVEQGGLKVITTLDYELQLKAENLVKKFVEDEQEKFNVYNAGLVGIDPKTGQILTMVGSKDWWGDPWPNGCLPGVDCRFDPHLNVVAYGTGRQPGSALKPFVYATLFKKGYSPDTTLFDLPTEFSPECDEKGELREEFRGNMSEEEIKEKEKEICYHPKNYDGKFRGPITIREALAQSVNVPAVKALYLAGLKDSLQTLKEAGINTLTDPQRYGLSLVLGGGEVKLLELVQAYASFATGGIFNPTTAILRIEDKNGAVLEEYKNKEKMVLGKEIAGAITNILSDNEARSPAFGPNSYLYFPDYPEEVAVKTGTTDDYRDAWVVGYTKDFALGVWFGNNDNSPMEKKIAGFIAAPLWNAFYKEVFKKYPPRKFEPYSFKEPEKPALRGEWRGSRVYLIDKISGKRATDFTPEELIEERVLREVHSILYWVNKDDPDGPFPENPSSDPQFQNWEVAVLKWKKENGITDQTLADLPKEFDDIHKPEYRPKITITNNLKNIYSPDDILEIRLALSSHFPIKQVDFFLDENFLGSVTKSPYEFKYNLGQMEISPGQNRLLIKAYDNVGNKGELAKTLSF